MSSVDIREMTAGDLDFCLEMFRITGWGNTADDVLRMISYEPGGCFAASLGRGDVGMVGSIGYGEVGYLGNLIVRPEHRGKGIGVALMKEAMEHLLESGAKSIRLDAVPKAIPLYQRLGFREESLSLRFTGLASEKGSTGCERMIESDLPAVLSLDLSFFGAPRGRVLRRVYADFPTLCFVAREGPRLAGYIMAKEGEGRTRIGPWICEADEQGIAENLLHRLMDEVAGSTLWIGVPEGNQSSVEILERNGFISGPSSHRMCHGECGETGLVEGIFGVGGPDKG
ncbi:GNAT family N-acetyltransferase [Candidatus Bathyarchaeota archaeon]|nr:GNAT family N-acetyltransferase [Candidatus Bathyarchaeota archaeon]MBL7080351.1 GNAT family N-acetyltransferase [Candidatus Bathyarchaeota archaeon]